MRAALRVVAGSATYSTRVPLSAIRVFLAKTLGERMVVYSYPTAAEKRLIHAADVYRTLKVLDGGVK